MNIELRKWSVEDKEVLIKMCNSIDRSFLSDRLPNPYTNASAEWWLTMVKDNEGKKGVFSSLRIKHDKLKLRCNRRNCSKCGCPVPRGRPPYISH